MKIQLLTAALLSSLMMTGPALAADAEATDDYTEMSSRAVEKHMQKIEENYIQTAEEQGELKALEQKVEELKEMIEQHYRQTTAQEGELKALEQQAEDLENMIESMIVVVKCFWPPSFEHSSSSFLLHSAAVRHYDYAA